MVRLIAVLLMCGVLPSGTCYANNFFKGLVGKWKLVHETTFADDNSTYRYEGVTTIRLLKSGVLYSETKGVADGRRSLAKGWAYPRGTSRGVSYIGGKKIDEVRIAHHYEDTSQGKWWIRNGKWFKKTRSEYGEADWVMRKINRNKYVSKGIHSDGFRSTSTLTRIR